MKPEKVEITSEDLETIHGEPRKAVSGAYGFAARLVWQYEGFIFIDGLNAVEVY